MALIVKPAGLEKIWASGGVKETPADSKIVQGHVVELPAYQYVNWLVNKQDTFLAHINQVGIPVWDAVTEYIGGKSYVQGTDGIVYKALLTNTNVVPSNPLNSATWVKAFENFGSVAALTVTVNNLSTNYSTLAGIANTATARTNLSVYSKTESDARFAAVLGNASNTFLVADATNDDHAINRGQLLSLLNQATEPAAGIAAIASQSESDVGTNDTKILTPKKATATFVKRSNNLSDLANVATARTNLSVYSKAECNSLFLDAASNLAELTNTATARANLGLGSIATASATDYLTKAGNLAGLTNIQTARNNLNLQALAMFNVLGLSTTGTNLSQLNFSKISDVSGMFSLPSGIAVQWVICGSGSGGTATATWPTPFLTILGGWACERNPQGWGADWTTVWAFDHPNSTLTTAVARMRRVFGDFVDAPAGIAGIIFGIGVVQV